MTEVNFQVRPGKLEDSKRVWEIRNNFLNRQNFNVQEEIPFADHQVWFAKRYFSGNGNKLFIIEVENQAAGYLRFDEEPYGYSSHIAMDPAYQGKGLGHALLSLGLKQAALTGQITAQIKKFNAPSLKLFEKCGYATFREDAENYFLQYEG